MPASLWLRSEQTGRAGFPGRVLGSKRQDRPETVEKPDSLMSGSTTFHKAAPLKRAALCISTLCLGRFAPVLLAVLASLSVLISLDVSDECPWTMSGPGLTYDENLNTASGVYLVESVLEAGLAALDPRTLNEIFHSPNYYPDYPPLGRLPLGLSNALLGRISGLGGHPFYLITYARVGSAITFGLLIFLVTGFTRRRASPVAGLLAGLSLWLMPRVFGHAHLACVETTMNLAYAASVCTCIELLSQKTILRARDGLLPGLVLGLALLTKIQAIFLPPVIVIWMLWHWRWRGILPLAVLAVTSAIVFFLGWPWLWNNPIERSVEYFAQTTNRAVLYCYYLGERYADRNVPWHYPFVMFIVTTPLPWLLLGGWGMSLTEKEHVPRRHREQRTPPPATQLTSRQNHLLLGSFWLPLIAFAIPGVPVYDGERLFLVVWPIFSIWIGIAGQKSVEWLDEKTIPIIRNAACAIILTVPAISLVALQPAHLSYYGEHIGGLRGASFLKLERDYWGESVTADFLERACAVLPEGSSLAIAPVLHPLFPQFLQQDSWLAHRPDLRIVAYDDQQPNLPHYILLVYRQADPWQSLLRRPAGTRVLHQFTRQGVILAEMLMLPTDRSSEAENAFERARQELHDASQQIRKSMIRERETSR